MNAPATTSKAMYWTGWVLSILPLPLMIMGGIMKVTKNPQVVEGFQKAGHPVDLATPIGIIELVCVAIFLFPRTAVLGAILLAAYLGGAVCSHVLNQDPLMNSLMPAIFGVVLWLGLWLRDARLRALLPFTSKV
ncbi:DoxX-like protein [Roseimicrobium gellanilyticum]|uniref:DoxX-like protein n=1 Tax=Roseimicrobium gellanilyticum TaxID=748857 RepID=A0A366H2L3_9BACT|nr:DoxX family protein [Roseimicrobium gellanilyticum]RBP36142.1 DoxX-like protein [Roseimicrobium gellanilyticum]